MGETTKTRFIWTAGLIQETWKVGWIRSGLGRCNLTATGLSSWRWENGRQIRVRDSCSRELGERCRLPHFSAADRFNQGLVCCPPRPDDNGKPLRRQMGQMHQPPSWRRDVVGTHTWSGTQSTLWRTMEGSCECTPPRPYSSPMMTGPGSRKGKDRFQATDWVTQSGLVVQCRR